MSTLFTKIIQGDIPCHRLLEDEQFLAFLDIRPINPGHTLVVPKIETDVFFDLEDNVLSRILVFAKPLASAIRQTVTCKRIGIMVAGLEIPHAHLHLVPIISEGDLTFARARSASQKSLLDLAKCIRAALPPPA